MITKQKIYEIIRDDVCGVCRINSTAITVIDCGAHYERCHSAYNRQAEKIMELIEKEKSE